MYIAIIVLAIAHAVMTAFAQSASFPPCALPCLLLANSGTCQLGDSSCLCQERSYVSSVETCLESRCSNADGQRALRAVSELCDLVTGSSMSFSSGSRTASIPLGSSSVQSVTSASAVTTPTVSGSTIPLSSTSIATASPSSVVIIGSDTITLSSGTGSVTTQVEPTTSAASTSTTRPSTTPTAPASSTSASPTGGALKMSQSGVVLLLATVGVVVVLS